MSEKKTGNHIVKLTKEQRMKYHGELCPYCGRKPELINSREIYGIECGLVWICKPCQAYVGVHKGTEKPLGRLAKKNLRDAKKEAHKWFDQLWQGKGASFTRKEAYQASSERLKIDKDYTHIGMFNIQTCRRVVEISKEILENLKQIDK